jgi:hypothetical protein
VRKSETVHPLKISKKRDPKARENTVFTDPVTNGRPDFNGQMFLQLPNFRTVATSITTPGFSPALEGPTPSVSIFNNANPNRPSKKISIDIIHSPLEPNHKNSEDMSLKDLTREKRCIF